MYEKSVVIPWADNKVLTVLDNLVSKRRTHHGIRNIAWLAYLPIDKTEDSLKFLKYYGLVEEHEGRRRYKITLLGKAYLRRDHRGNLNLRDVYNLVYLWPETF